MRAELSGVASRLWPIIVEQVPLGAFRLFPAFPCFTRISSEQPFSEGVTLLPRGHLVVSKDMPGGQHQGKVLLLQAGAGVYLSLLPCPGQPQCAAIGLF